MLKIADALGRADTYGFSQLLHNHTSYPQLAIFNDAALIGYSPRDYAGSASIIETKWLRCWRCPWIDPVADARLPHLQTCKNPAQTMIHEESEWGSEIPATGSSRHRRRQAGFQKSAPRPPETSSKSATNVHSASVRQLG